MVAGEHQSFGAVIRAMAARPTGALKAVEPRLSSISGPRGVSNPTPRAEMVLRPPLTYRRSMDGARTLGLAEVIAALSQTPSLPHRHWRRYARLSSCANH